MIIRDLTREEFLDRYPTGSMAGLGHDWYPAQIGTGYARVIDGKLCLGGVVFTDDEDDEDEDETEY